MLVLQKVPQDALRSLKRALAVDEAFGRGDGVKRNVVRLQFEWLFDKL